MILSGALLKLEAVLAGAVSANQPECTVDYIDWNAQGQETPPATVRTALNSNTDVTILAAPQTSVNVGNPVREPIRVAIYNKDTASVTVTVKTDDGTTERIIIKATLLTLESLHWDRANGWYSLDASGNLKQAQANVIIDNSATITVKDNKFTLQDDGDITKQGQFQLSGITAGNTRTLTWPDAAGTIVLSSDVKFTAHTRQVLTSGSSATYTTPANVRQLVVRAWGGGGGGSGSASPGNTGNSGTAGNSTTFNSIVAAGGGAGTPGVTVGGAGGTGGSGSASFRLAGSPGGGMVSTVVSATNFVSSGGNGGGQGGGRGGDEGAASNGVANTGGGGGGGGIGSVAFGLSNEFGNGGGSGEYFEYIVNSPSGTYTYTVGAAANGGTGGTGGFAGGNGASGLIIVDEYY